MGKPCTYCGEDATELDHVWPKSVVGEDTVKVPVCRECNSALGAILLPNVIAKIHWIKAWLKRHYARVLTTKSWTEDELGTLGPELRQRIKAALLEKDRIIRRINYQSKSIKLPKCIHCENTFFPRRFWQRFCSDKCRVAANVEERKKALEAYRGSKK